jgi:hypothetical protein
MKTCKFCGAPALEQVRGQLGENDKGYVAPRGDGPHANSNNAANATDTRVVCSNTKLAMRGPNGSRVTIEADAQAWNLSYNGEGFVFPFCDNQTGWNKAEFADFTRFKWDRDHGA